jgi:hypothetical protein
MAVIKAVSSRARIETAINYITQEEKTDEKLISGIECSPDTAIEEMKTTKELWNKTDGRQYKHYVQSFPPEEKITPQQAHEIAQELCFKRFKGFEVLIATHKDKDHIHSHIIINSVNYENGRKIQDSGKDLQSMKDYSDKLCKERGFSICEKGEEITAYKKDKYKALERGITEQGYKSYVLNCYKTVGAVKKKAISREDFIEKMKKLGYETKWTDRKYITFTDQDGNKVRNSNLEKTFKEPFGKEELERGFESNLERTRTTDFAREQLRIIGSERIDRGTVTEDAEDVLNHFDTTIAKSKADIKSDDSQRADRIAYEKSLQSERNRIEIQRDAEENQRSRGRER